ncbi:FAD/NAD(P)-binding protein [Phreatobacter sp. AB_2022a]|uniref:FAD/NAD(P)-binding protein n=1 Tax=Phreatobacter sp. AB_2022a TaxID=3003134 RepID=UPI0022871EB4|nr:FAD/NAD(P)-binding protein [Phreatobacter sp. AB_2022a]MCZ0737585.1 FAD/NAD(P)-binding protein [Phreatobacter sp. AB_2022a]
MEHGTTDIAIVGGGASGALLAVRLMHRMTMPVRVTLFDRSARPGLGIAYATTSCAHLLNTRAGDMSAFAEDPDHFRRWAGVTAGGFVPRQLYGRYLQAMLADAAAAGRGRLQIVADDVVGLRPAASDLILTTAGGASLAARFVVLATGYRPPAADTGLAWRRDPWGSDIFDGLDPAGQVLLVGTGLTMIDMVISLMERDHLGQIVALSRRGLLPRTHPPDAGAGAGADTDLLFAGRLSRRLARFRALSEAAGGWEAVMQDLRPRNGALWHSLDDRQRRRFLRHLRPWWEVHRHRAPPSVGVGLKAVIAAGQLTVLAGRLLAIEATGEQARVTVQLREGGRHETHVFDRVVDCSGARCDPDDADRLQAQMLRDGLMRADRLGLGIDVDGRDRVLDRDGVASQRLFALGPPTRGRHWEITAIPDIRRRAAELAEALLVGLAQGSAAAS